MSHIKFDNGITVTTSEDVTAQDDVIRISDAVIKIGRDEYIARDITLHMDKHRIDVPMPNGSTVQLETKFGKANFEADNPPASDDETDDT